jgi:hypothetical protein
MRTSHSRDALGKQSIPWRSIRSVRTIGLRGIVSLRTSTEMLRKRVPTDVPVPSRHSEAKGSRRSPGSAAGRRVSGASLLLSRCNVSPFVAQCHIVSPSSPTPSPPGLSPCAPKPRCTSDVTTCDDGTAVRDVPLRRGQTGPRRYEWNGAVTLGAGASKPRRRQNAPASGVDGV